MFFGLFAAPLIFLNLYSMLSLVLLKLNNIQDNIINFFSRWFLFKSYERSECSYIGLRDFFLFFFSLKRPKLCSRSILISKLDRILVSELEFI